MSKEKVNILDYTYVKGQKVELEGGILIAMLNFCKELKIAETKEVMLLNVPKRITKEGVEWKGTTPLEFFQQTPVEGLTEIGAKALDMEFTLARVHEENVLNNKATHRDELLKKTTDTDKSSNTVSQTLEKSNTKVRKGL